MDIFAVAIVGAVATIAGGVFGFLAVRRKSSGRIDTTEAVTLWTEGTVLRQELRDEIVRLRGEAAQLRVEAVQLRSELALAVKDCVELRAQFAALHEEANLMRRENAEYRRITHELGRENVDIRRRLGYGAEDDLENGPTA